MRILILTSQSRNSGSWVRAQGLAYGLEGAGLDVHCPVPPGDRPLFAHLDLNKREFLPRRKPRQDPHRQTHFPSKDKVPLSRDPCELFRNLRHGRLKKLDPPAATVRPPREGFR